VQIALLLRTRSLPVTRFSLISGCSCRWMLGALSYIVAVLVTANPWVQALLSLVVFTVRWW